MSSCVRNIRIENYQNLIIGVQVTVENVRDAFWDSVQIIMEITRTIRQTDGQTDDQNT